MTCRCPPFGEAVLAEASRISPNRRKSSDGCVGDQTHRAAGGDHNCYGSSQWCHAVDISQSVPGSPFWQSRFGRFDAHAYGLKIAARRDPRVKYLVANFGGPDMIWSHDHDWRQNGSYKRDHASHLHCSFTVAAEQSTAPFFQPEDDDVTPAEMDAIVNRTADKVLRALGRQPDGTPGLIGDELAHVMGGYDDHGNWVDAAALADYRKRHGLAKP